MLVDSHCHLNFIDLSDFNDNLNEVIEIAQTNGVERFLCVCVELSDYPTLCKIAETYPQVSISVGLHPNSEVDNEPDPETLYRLAKHRSCVAIGETGLDYYRTTTDSARLLQQERFSNHIQAALASEKPLIIHIRQAQADTIKIMREENASRIGGVMHCFSEDWDVAQLALDMNFYISLSGIVTFKNASTLHDVAKKMPLDRLLIETDSPYLAPVPFRGKQNHPALVRHVAEAIAQLRGTTYEEIATQTTANYYRCFGGREDSLD